MLIATGKSRYAVEPLFQIICMFISLAAIVVVLYPSVVGYAPIDQEVPVLSMTPQRLAEIGGEPARVTVGMYIRDIPENDIVAGRFVADMTLWFQFNPRLIDLEQVSQFSFERGYIKRRSEPFTFIIDGMMFAQYDLRVEFHLALNYDDFPLDDHRVNFVLTYHYLSISDVLIESSRAYFGVGPDVIIPGWKILDKAVASGYSKDTLDSLDDRKNLYQPRLVFTIDLIKEGVRHLISIFLPLIIIFFVALFSFSYEPKEEGMKEALTLSVGSITGLIAFRFVIESMSPPASGFMSSDKIFLYFLVATFIVFFLNLFARYITIVWKKLILVALHCSTICMFLYITRNYWF